MWEQELDIYGRVRARPVEMRYGQVVDDGMFDEHFVPFRYQGQYSDEELDGELYYNRHRYYDPQLGQYITQDPIGLAGGNPTLYGYVGDTNTWIDPLGLVKVEHFPDFDSALREAFKIATGGDSNVTFSPTKVDPITGTEVEFVGSNGSKIAFDAPHADMDGELGHDKPHIGAQSGGKRSSGGASRKNLTYDGKQHPFRSPNKGDGAIRCR